MLGRKNTESDNLVGNNNAVSSKKDDAATNVLLSTNYS